MLRVVIDTAVAVNKAIHELKQEDFRHDPQAIEFSSLFEKETDINNVLQVFRHAFQIGLPIHLSFIKAM